VLVPDDGETCEIKNKVDITLPHAPTFNNTNPGNDSSSATADLPSDRCHPTLLRLVCPLPLRMPDGECCPEGEPWNGRSCGTSTAPPTACPPNTTGQYPDCKPIDLTCPAGTTGIYPDCKKVTKPKCPTGTTGTYPDCRRVTIPRCPQGTTGIYPNCVPNPVCPDGTRGTYPNCTPILIPQCPDGTTGIYPNCTQKPTGRPCPQGYVGTVFPDCKKVDTGGPNTQGGGVTTAPDNNAPQPCPPGTFGPGQPLCIPLPQQEQEVPK